MSLSNRLHVSSENVTGPRKLNQNESAPVRPRRVFGEFSNVTSNNVPAFAKSQLPGNNETLLKSSKKLSLKDENAPVKATARKLEVSKALLRTQKEAVPLKETELEKLDSWSRKDENKHEDFFKSEYSLDFGKSGLSPISVTSDINSANTFDFDIKEDSIGLMLDDLALNLNSSNIVKVEDPILDLNAVLDSWEKDTFSRKPESFDSFRDSKYDLDLGKKELKPEPFSKSDRRPNEYLRMMEEPLNFDMEKHVQTGEIVKETLEKEAMNDLAQKLQQQLDSFDLAEFLAL